MATRIKLNYLWFSLFIISSVHSLTGCATSPFDQAFQLQEEGRLEEAVKYYKQALNNSRTSGSPINTAIILSNISKNYYLQKDYQRSIDYTERTFEELNNIVVPKDENPKDVKLKKEIYAFCFIRNGNCHFKLGNYSKARNFYIEGDELLRQLGAGGVSGNLGATYHMLGDVDRAEQYYQLAVEKDGILSMWQGNLSILFKQKGEYEKAWTHYEQFIDFCKQNKKIDGCDPNDVQHGKGELFLAVDKDEKALEIFSKQQYKGGLADYYMKKNNFQKAKDFYLAALEQDIIEQRRSGLWIGTGKAFESLGDYQSAEIYYKKAADYFDRQKDQLHTPDHKLFIAGYPGPGIYRRIEAYQGLERINKAPSELNMSVTFDDRSSILSNNMVDASEQSSAIVDNPICGDVEQCIVESKIKNEPKSEKGNSPTPSDVINWLQWKKTDQRLSFEEWKNLQKSKDEKLKEKIKLSCLIHVGNCHFRVGQFSKARYHYIEADELSKWLGAGGVPGNLGATYHILGDLGQAEQYYQLAVEKDGILSTWQGNLSVLFKQKGEYEKAWTHYEQFINFCKQNKKVDGCDPKDIQYGKGELLLAMDKDEQALDLFSKQEYKGGLADYYLKKDNFQKAKDFYLAALEKVTDKRRSELWIGTGKAFEGLGDYQNAEFYYKIATVYFDREKGQLDAQDHRLYNAGFPGSGIYRRIEAYQGLERINQAPSELNMSVAFDDRSSILPNKMVDAGEQSSIVVKLANTGLGKAYDTKLVTLSNTTTINVPATLVVGNIAAKETREVVLPLKTDLNVADGRAIIEIRCEERRGYDSKTVVLQLPTKALRNPALHIANYKINDSATGFARGNGNGIPENGETIELIPFVKNSGVGKAIQVNLYIASINQGIEIKRKSVSIREIQPGQTASGSLVFSIPRTYAGSEIKVDLTATDVRGASEDRRLYAISMQSHQPVLAYTYKIIDRNRNGFVESGEDGEIEINPANTGEMEAKHITINVNSNDLSISKTQMSIEQISANSKYVPLRFAFKVPRTIEKDSVDVQLQMTQKDFAGITDHINIPIKLVIPEFQITHQLFDANNNGAIEQGEKADLIVKVKNTGDLDANNVVLSMKTGAQGKIREGVILTSNKEVSIGRIAAGKSSEPQYFKILVQARADTGELPIQFAINQADFSQKDVSIALNIAPEKPEVITVAGQMQSPKTLPVSTARYNSPPQIVIAFPKDNQRSASASELLAGTVADDKGVSSIEIFLNGRRLDVARDIAVKPAQNRKEQDFRLSIPLQMGKNEIKVTAFDIENLTSSKKITVYREKQRGEIWAVVIGLNQYQNPQIPTLKYALNDAKAFADYLKSNMGLDQQHLFELYDNEVTYRKLRSLLGTKISRQADNPEDTVFIYFAGHGAPEEDPLNRDGDGIEKYLLAYDTDPNDLYGTAMPMDEIAKIFSRIRAERVIFIADSCYSGGSGGRTILAAGRRANLSEGFLERLAQGKGRIILTSSRANETSQESDQLGHGYFTHSLLEGLSGKADVSQDGLIDVDEIYLYLNRRVPEMTNGAQHPVKKGEAEGQLIVGRVR